jgi:hypothetical protein
MHYFTSHTASNNQIVFYLSSIFFVALNLFTIEWFPLPWIDEISLHDSSINFALDGEWRTTAFFGDRNNEVYSTYPPLYQFLLVPWVWLFGVSPLACRSLNIVLVFLICVITYRFLRRSNVIRDYTSLVIFLLLFWCAGIFSWIYRNGRPDILNMLCAVCFLTCYYEKRSRWLLVLFSFLTVISGIQACPYLMGMLVCLYVFHPEKKGVKTALSMFIAGTAAGLIFLTVCFYLQGHLLQFYYRSFILFSESVKSIISFFSSHIEHLPADIKEALLKPVLSTPTSFFEKMMAAYLVNTDRLMLCSANGTVYLWLLFKRKIVYRSTESKLIFITLLIPAVMTVAGRFAVYYSWMCYIPSVLYSVYVVGKHKRHLFVSFVYGLATLAVVSSGLPRTLITADKKAYKRVETFVLQQNFSNGDKIVSPFVAYYVIRNITRECYFTGVYPLSLVPADTKYILTARDDYGNENMEAFIEQCKSAGKKVSVIDRLKSPDMTLYLVE